MSTLEFRDYVIPSAEIYDENRMADIGNVRYIHGKYSVAENVSEEDARYIGKGMINTLLPYTLQDHYGRQRKDRAKADERRIAHIFAVPIGKIAVVKAVNASAFSVVRDAVVNDVRDRAAVSARVHIDRTADERRDTVSKFKPRE